MSTHGTVNPRALCPFAVVDKLRMQATSGTYGTADITTDANK